MLRERDLTISLRPVTSERSCSISAESWDTVTEETVGTATSMTLSVRVARLSKEVPSVVEASIILTLAGSRCRNSSCNRDRSMAPALSPRSC